FNDSSDNPTTLLLRAKAFLGVLVLNSSTNSITANTVGTIRPFMIFVTEEVFIGQLFDAYIFRISQVATISMRDNPEDEVFVSGIKKLFQGRSFYYASFFNPELNNNKRYFTKPYDITLCAQRMVHGHDSDIRFFWNRGLCLPLLKFNIDIRYWIPKIMCGGIETYRNPNEDIELWLISRLSCERAGTRFNVRGVNDDGAVANFVETEQIVFVPRQNHYSSFVIIRGSIPLFWHQPGFQVGTHRITVLRSEALSFKAFFEHFKYLYRHYGRVLIINLVDKREDEKPDGIILTELFRMRPEFVRKEKFRVSIGTWNINGDKNPALENEYPSILDAWILDGPENLSVKTRKNNSISTNGFVSDDYVKLMPDILAIGFQEICDLTATNMVWQRNMSVIERQSTNNE
ncbi:unnamed protein product, partial [Rotaria magnacalcarata]